MKVKLILQLLLQLLLLLLIGLSSSCTTETTVDQKENQHNEVDGGPYFWVSMPKAYFTSQNYGVELNAYAVRNQAFVGKLENDNVQQLVAKSKSDTSFYIVVTSDKWHLILGDREDFVNMVKDTANVKAYLLYVKKLFQNLSNFQQGIVNFEPDPMGSFYKILSKHYNGDPTLVSVPLSDIDIPEIAELNPPNNFAGFWQVIDYLRKKYAPQIKIAPTIKMWGISGHPTQEPAGGWTYDNPEVKPMWEYYARYGVDWDGLAFNFNTNWRPDSEFKSTLKYFSAVAEGMSREFDKPIYTFIWKVRIFDYHYTESPDNWDVNEVTFLFKNITFLASLGIRGMIIGYGSELHGKYAPESELPPAIVCWLKEYFLDEDCGCAPQGTIGLQEVKLN